MADRNQAPISIKVMRLSRPNLSNSQPLFLDHSLNEKKGTRSVILQGLNNLYKSEGAKFGKLSNHYKTKTKNQDKGEERDAIEEETNTGFMGDTERLNYPISEKLLIPKAFGSLYLGEQVVLQFLIINESPQTLHAVKCKIEVQSNTQKQAIFDSFSSGFEAQGGGGGAAQEGVVLGSQQIFNFQAKHETKELGVHVIVCTIEFINAVKARQTIKKIFKFQVDNPLMVKTKVNHLKADQVYLEVQIQNVTKDVMWLEKMELEPHSEFEATNLNVSEDNEIWSTPFLDPNCARQYLYMLTPKNSILNNANIDSESYRKARYLSLLGKLDIIWRWSFGTTGRLQTSQLVRNSPGIHSIELDRISIAHLVKKPGTGATDVTTKQTHGENTVVLEEPFMVCLTIRNTTETEMNIEVEALSSAESQAIAICGFSQHKVDRLQPFETANMSLYYLPLAVGVHSIGDLIFKSSTNGAVSTFKDPITVLVL